MLKEKEELGISNMKIETEEAPHTGREKKTVTLHVDTNRGSPGGAREPGTGSWLREPGTAGKKKGHAGGPASPLNEAKPMSDYMDEKFREDHKSMFVFKEKL